MGIRERIVFTADQGEERYPIRMPIMLDKVSVETESWSGYQVLL